MSDEQFEDQAIEGVLESGVSVELARWASDGMEYDADGWLDSFGDRVGNGIAKLPGKVWVDLTRFCVLRPVVRVP
jgi:hypothetical protein